MALFQTAVLKKHLKQQESDIVAKAYKKFAKYFHNPTIQQNIRQRKEEQFQEGFLIELFVNVLDYTLAPNPEFNLTTELKNEKGAKKADGAILSRSQDPLAKPFALGVIELKSTKTKDLEKVRQQAFDYKANQTGCVYVITSNFEKVRFYINNAVEFEEFDLFTINRERFELLYLCLAKDNLLGNIPLKIKEASIQEEEKITKKFYADYSLFKRELFRDLVKLNMKNEVFRAELNTEDAERANKNIKHNLFKKSQKLIDRFLFIFFAEDRGLLPPNSTLKILEQWDKLKDLDAYTPLYERYKLYFNYLDTGRKGSDKSAEIFAYNGGLFKPDAILDSLQISDELLYRCTKELQAYDFESQVDVNILGHIFENSLNEIESVNAEIEGTDFDKQKTKRKKDGVFYTPKYITKYIVDNTVGKLCNEKKEALKIVEEEYHPKRQKETKKKLLAALETYREWLLQLTILDPACGSGAFLNQALDFLIKEHGYIDELQTNLLGGGLVFPNIENTVLENNIFGVDINEESVDIARLSLWLRTAQPRRKLNDLSENIKCGNSLIDSKAVAGDKAFKWEEEFPNIFEEKEKKAWHITTATHDSRTSQRMIDYKVRELRDNGMRPKAEGIWLAPEDEMLITQTIAKIVKEDNLNVMAYNICGDHIHVLLVCEEEEVSKIIGKIKGKTSRIYNNNKGINPLVKKEGEKSIPLWTQKFGNNPIKDEKQLWNTVEYIQNNRAKHELPPLPFIKGINPLVPCSYEHAFRTEYKGGFDVVIGNPPYVRQELIKPFKEYLSENYRTYQSSADLYVYFIELSIDKLISKTGIYSIIVANKWMRANYGHPIRSWLKQKDILEIIDFGDLPVFEDATAYPCILSVKGGQATTYFKGIQVSNLEFPSLDYFVETNSINVNQTLLDDSAWSLTDERISKLISRLKGSGTDLKTFIDNKMYVGLKTGFNAAFIIDKNQYKHFLASNSKNEELLKPYAVGRDIIRYGKPVIDKYLICIPSKWTNSKGTFSSENEAWTWFQIQYPELSAHLEQFIVQAKKRTDKGEYWWELRACEYYNEFEKSKIIYSEIATEGRFTIDSNNLYCDMTAFIIGSNSPFLLAILNSNLFTYLFKHSSSEIRGGFLRWKRQYMYPLPIPDIQNENSFNSLTFVISEKVIAKQTIIEQFQVYIQSQFAGIGLAKKLQNWHKQDFTDFIKELNKAIKKRNKEVAIATTSGHVPLAKLSKMDEMEWMEVFETKKAEAQTLKAEIDKTDAEIDQMVYELYGLSEEEIKIVEGN